MSIITRGIVLSIAVIIIASLFAVPVQGNTSPVDSVCESLNADTETLPTELIPGASSIPDSISPSTVPTNLLTTEAVLGIVLGFAPEPCNIVDPNDPQIDLTDPPTDPDGNIDVARFGQFSGGGVGLVYYDGTLDSSEDGPSIHGYSGALATPDFSDVDQQLVMNDGSNEYGADSLRLRENSDGTQGEAVLILVGKEAGVTGSCNELQQFNSDLSVDRLQNNPLGPCEYKLIGLPNLFGPSDLTTILTESVSTNDGLPVNEESLPVNVDALMNL